ncbi:type II toxin-antitoxin system VapC family toxin [Synechococcus sp. Cu2B8-bc1011]|uniref:type II toxin-antitoxin system VapC family toxin n=1 Tax=Synechococcus sp. Cu2B8-bc1011 TaxID=3093725 RepID=UPI0039B10940
MTNGPRADRFLEVLDDEKYLIVPAITVFEVFKWILREYSEAQAIQAIAVMQGGKVVDLDSSIATAAAQFSHALRLPMAVSIILITARQHQARLFSMDAYFKSLADVGLILKVC